MSVTCPVGVTEGNTIIVRSPFGTRKAPITCPKGIMPGQTFVAHLPGINEKMEGPHFQNLGVLVDDWLTPTPEVVGRPV